MDNGFQFAVFLGVASPVWRLKPCTPKVSDGTSIRFPLEPDVSFNVSIDRTRI